VVGRLEHGRWRDNVLKALACRPTEVVKLARELPTDEEKERVLCALADHAVMRTSFQRLALELKTPACRARSLARLLKNAPEEFHAGLSRGAVAAARQSGDEALLEEVWQQALGTLSAVELEEGLADLRARKEPKRRAALGRALLSRAPPEARDAPARELLEAVRRLEPGERAAAFGGSARHLPAGLVPEALELLRDAPGGEAWFRAHEAWVPYLTEAQLDRLLVESAELGAEVLLEVCKPEFEAVAREVRRGDMHGAEQGCLGIMVLLALVARHPGWNRERLIDRVLTGVAGLRERRVQAGVLVRLAPVLDELPAGTERMVVELLEEGAERARVLEAVGRLLSVPVILSLLEVWARAPHPERARDLAALAWKVSEARRREVTGLLLGVVSPVRAWGLAAFAPGLAGSTVDEWWLPAVEGVQRSRDEDEARELFSLLIRSSPWRLIPELFARAAREEFARARWFILLVVEWSERIPALLGLAVEVAGLLPVIEQVSRLEHRVRDLWTLAQGSRDARARVIALVRLVPLRHTHSKDEASAEALNALEKLEADAGLRWELLLELIPHLPEPLVRRAVFLAWELKPRTPSSEREVHAAWMKRSRPYEVMRSLTTAVFGNAPGMERPPEVPPEEKQALALEVLERLSPPAEPVLLGTSAPAEVSPGDDFTVRFVACVERLAREVTEKLAHLGPGTNTALGFQRCQWQLGSRFRVRVTSPFLHISTGEQELLWNGEACSLDFGVQVPPRAHGRRTSLQFEVFLEGVRVALLRHDLTVVERKRTPGRRRVALRRAPRTAFASFAADDRNRVLDRVASLRLAAGLDVFMDCLSLKPGEPWKKVLRTEIQRRDVFLLFWSCRARDSQWVEWEWRTALRLKRRGAIQPHPLEPVSVAPPPKELAMLHFGDAYVLARNEGPPRGEGG
jgi:hypothetical protein